MLRPTVMIVLLTLCAGPACTPLAPGGAAAFEATGIEGAYSRQVVVADGGHDVMVGQVLVLRQNGRLAFTAVVGQLRHSGQVPLRMESAWSGGRAVPFEGGGRRERFCTRRGHCRGSLTGTFVLTRAAFDAALHGGLSATLVGPDAVVEVRFPPQVFAEARDRARAAGLLPAD